VTPENESTDTLLGAHVNRTSRAITLTDRAMAVKAGYDNDTIARRA
jgi:hypothetical protein